MNFLVIVVISTSGIILGKLLFRKWINHLTVYCVIWGGLVYLYELKLLPYVSLIPLAWFYIIAAFISFLLGIVTVVTIKSLYPHENISARKSYFAFNILRDDGKALKYSIFIFSTLCIVVAILNWIVLIKIFGSISSVFINENILYGLSRRGGIKNGIPYISILGFGYIAILFSGIYTAYKGKFTFLTLYPFIGIIIQELASAGRVGILFASMEFAFSFFLFRNLLKETSTRKFRFSKGNAVFATIFLIFFLIVTSSFIRITRGSFENYVGASRELTKSKNNFILSPSIYLYLSSDVGVLSQYLKAGGENTKFGQNSFLIFYDLLAKLGMVKRPNDYQKGYYIPMWTNTGTYIRELHADFGIPGVFLGPYLIGLLSTWLWYKFYAEKSLAIFTFLVYLYLIVGFSFLVMISRLPSFFISILIIMAWIPIMEKMAGLLHKRSLIKLENKL